MWIVMESKGLNGKPCYEFSLTSLMQQYLLLSPNTTEDTKEGEILFLDKDLVLVTLPTPVKGHFNPRRKK